MAKKIKTKNSLKKMTGQNKKPSKKFGSVVVIDNIESSLFSDRKGPSPYKKDLFAHAMSGGAY